MSTFLDQIPTLRKVPGRLAQLSRGACTWPAKFYRKARDWRIRFYRWLFTWRTARRILLGSAGLATLLAIFCTEENWRGKRAWDAYKSELKAKGVPFEIAQIVPPPIPDDQNFAMTPLLRGIYLSDADGKPSKAAKAAIDRLNRLAVQGKHGSMLPDHFGDWAKGKPLDIYSMQEYLGTGDIVQLMEKLAPELDEISLASRRPGSRFPLEYEKGFSMSFPQAGWMRNLGRLYSLRAAAELAQGQVGRAADDTVTLLRLVNCDTNEPLLISQLISVSLCRRSMQTLWEGLATHRWSEGQLAAFQTELQKFDYLAGMVRGLEGEHVMANKMLEDGLASTEGLGPLMRKLDGGHYVPNPGATEWDILRQSISEKSKEAWEELVDQIYPQGWIYQNIRMLNQDWEALLLPYNVLGHRFDVALAKTQGDEFSRRTLTPYTYFLGRFGVSAPAVSTLGLQMAYTQAKIDEAQVACALERYRLANGKWPEKLEELVPQFITKLPTDIISGGPMHYFRQENGRYLLYTVGANEKDDGGIMNDGYSDNEGDWVWPDAVRVEERPAK